MVGGLVVLDVHIYVCRGLTSFVLTCQQKETQPPVLKKDNIVYYGSFQPFRLRSLNVFLVSANQPVSPFMIRHLL